MLQYNIVANCKTGIVIIPNQAKVLPHELEVANILIKSGHDVVFIPIKNHKTPDICFQNCDWEIKSPIGNGERTIENILRKASKQSVNIVLDTRRTKLSTQEIYREIERQAKCAHNFRKVVLIDKRGKLVFVT